jgi:hypothetical protein
MSESYINAAAGKTASINTYIQKRLQHIDNKKAGTRAYFALCRLLRHL